MEPGFDTSSYTAEITAGASPGALILFLQQANKISH